jgi:uncharacterized protein (DUF2249 family)
LGVAAHGVAHASGKNFPVEGNFFTRPGNCEIKTGQKFFFPLQIDGRPDANALSKNFGNSFRTQKQNGGENLWPLKRKRKLAKKRSSRSLKLKRRTTGSGSRSCRPVVRAVRGSPRPVAHGQIDF